MLLSGLVLAAVALVTAPLVADAAYSGERCDDPATPKYWCFAVSWTGFTGYVSVDVIHYTGGKGGASPQFRADHETLWRNDPQSGLWLLLVGAPAVAEAPHRVSACGRLLEYSPPPGDDPASGLGIVRIATASGEVTFLFHDKNAAGLPSRTGAGATQVSANVCFTGTHVQSASPLRPDYVSPYELVLASAASPSSSQLPNTSTGPPGTRHRRPRVLASACPQQRSSRLRWRRSGVVGEEETRKG